jgi:hypothetical protein
MDDAASKSGSQCITIDYARPLFVRPPFCLLRSAPKGGAVAWVLNEHGARNVWALRTQGVEFQELIFPDEIHGFKPIEPPPTSFQNTCKTDYRGARTPACSVHNRVNAFWFAL